MRTAALAPLSAALLGAVAVPAAGECPGAERLSQALRLVEQANPVLRAERATANEQARQRSWTAEVSIGYSITETLETGAAGPNARLNVRIPLFDRTAKLQQAKDAAAITASTDALRIALIADIQALCEQAHQVRALERRRDFTRIAWPTARNASIRASTRPTACGAKPRPCRPPALKPSAPPPISPPPTSPSRASTPGPSGDGCARYWRR